MHTQWLQTTKYSKHKKDVVTANKVFSFRNDGLPVITSIKFDGPLKMGVGTSTGHVLLYDLRSSKPLLVKDHMNGLPIKKLEFHESMDYVYSMDSTVVKIWDKNTVSSFDIINYQPDDIHCRIRPFE